MPTRTEPQTDSDWQPKTPVGQSTLLGTVLAELVRTGMETET